jgi:hypothetical protein
MLPALSLAPPGHALIVTAYLNDSQNQCNLLYWLARAE